MRRRRIKESNDSDNWLTTYSDLVTLLLCFFILLFSFSEIDAQKFRSIMSSFQGGTGVLNGGTTLELDENLELESGALEEDLEKLKDLLEDYADSIGLGDEILLTVEERGLVIRFMDNVLFDSGKADLKPESMEILKSVSEILNMDDFKEKLIKIEGHTDTDPILYSEEFPTNWELSSTRSTNVLRYLVEEQGIRGNRISSSGYSFYRPIAPNDTKENKAKNRRVDIVILGSSYEDMEPK
ncbi:MAG: flagellar motor protein MotB [Tissierellia bacterium]|nr:flagellar motor protein MotB [Tissierellia bacterium]